MTRFSAGDIDEIADRIAARLDNHQESPGYDYPSRIAALLRAPSKADAKVSGEPVGFTVIAVRSPMAGAEQVGIVSSVWPDRDGADRHREFIQAQADAEPWRYGAVRYEVVEIRQVVRDGD
jgi:hypothetical protein